MFRVALLLAAFFLGMVAESRIEARACRAVETLPWLRCFHE